MGLIPQVITGDLDSISTSLRKKFEKSKIEGINTEGLYYRLIDDTLFFGSTRGVSNVLSKTSAKITLKQGVALVQLNYMH